MANGVIIGMLAKAAIPAIIEAVRNRPHASPETIEKDVVPAVKAAMAADPKVVNEIGQEHPLQSRTTWGASLGMLVTSGSALWMMFRSGSFNPELFVAQAAAFLSCAYVLYGRWAPGLKPLFWRKTPQP